MSLDYVDVKPEEDKKITFEGQHEYVSVIKSTDVEEPNQKKPRRSMNY